MVDKMSKDQLVGSWVLQDGAMKLDHLAEEIERRIREEFKSIATADWSGLFVDTDGDYWELTCPKSESHGGGAKCLTKIKEIAARSVYDF